MKLRPYKPPPKPATIGPLRWSFQHDERLDRKVLWATALLPDLSKAELVIELQLDADATDSPVDPQADATRTAGLDARLPAMGGGWQIRGLADLEAAFDVFEANPEPEPSHLVDSKQVATVDYIRANARAIRLAVRDHARETIPGLRRASAEDQRFELSGVEVGRPRGDRVLFRLVGDCGWDEEHGLAVVMEGLEVREMGGVSDVAL